MNSIKVHGFRMSVFPTEMHRGLFFPPLMSQYCGRVAPLLSTADASVSVHGCELAKSRNFQDWGPAYCDGGVGAWYGGSPDSSTPFLILEES